MRIDEYREAIKEELTGGVLDLELDDATIDKLILSALREIQRYIDATKIITIPFTSCIDLSDQKVDSVVRVFRTAGYVNDAGDSVSSQTDPMYVSQWQMLAGAGYMQNFTDYALNYASWNTMNQIRNTMSTDLAFRYDAQSEKLYINIAGDRPNTITVEYVPHIEDVDEIKSAYWIDILTRLSIAQTKIVIGRIRSRYTQSNALWQQDGETMLTEGKTERDELRAALKADTQLVYPID